MWSRAFAPLFVVLGACGRISFDPNGDAAASTALVFADLTTAAPMLTAPLAATSDCGKYLIGLGGYGIPGQFWRPSTVTVGSDVYITLPCKYGDTGGWDLGLARVPLGLTDYSGAGVWLDGNASLAGTNEFVNHTELDAQGTTLLELGTLVLGTNGSSLFGIGLTGSGSAVPLTLSEPTALAANRYDLTRGGSFDFAAKDGTWRGATELDRAIIYYDGVYNVFTVTYDEPNERSTFLVVSTTIDGSIPQLATAPLRASLSSPVVATAGSHIYLIAVDDSEGRYVVIQGDSIAELGTAPAVPLDLAPFRGPVGSWNHDFYAYTPAGEPRIVGAAVDGKSLLLFYWAGVGEYIIATAPYSASRSLGVLAGPL